MKSTHWVMKKVKVFFIHWHIWVSFVVTKNCSEMSLFTRWQMYKSRSDDNVRSLCVRLCFWYQNGTQYIPADRIFRKSLVLKESYKLCFLLFKTNNEERHKWQHRTKTNKRAKLRLNNSKKLHFVYTWKMVCLF